MSVVANTKPGEALKYRVQHDVIDPGSVLGHVLALIPERSRILELGCATGGMTRVLQSRHGCRIDAIEVDPVAAEEARVYCERLLVDDLETLDWGGAFFAGQVYDHVLAADVLEHLRDPARVLNGLLGLVQPGGSLIVSTPNISYAGVQAAMRHGWFPYAATGLLDQGHVHFFTRLELELLMLASGWVPLERRAVRWSPQDSEFGAYWRGLEPHEQTVLLSGPDADVYQWVVVAEKASHSAWRRHLQGWVAKADLKETKLQERIVALQAELEASRRRLEHLLDEGTVQEQRLRCLESELQELRARTQTAEAALRQALSSRSWRLTAPLRQFSESVARWGSRVHQVRVSLRERGVRPTLQAIAKTIRDGRRAPVRPQGGTAPVRGSELLTGDWEAYRAWLAAYEVLPADGAHRVAEALQAEGSQPRFGIVMPVYNPDLKWLREAVDSVRGQWYPHWRLYLVDDCSTRQRAELLALFEGWAAQDPRIRVMRRERNGHISAATNDGLAAAEEEWVTFVDQDDLLAPHALWCIADAIRRHPEVRVVYSDEDKIDELGRRREPHFKPDWNPDLLLSYNYICHLVAYRREDVAAVGGLRQGYEGAQDYDLALRVLERCDASEIVHVPRILYHWRVHAGSTARDVAVKPYAIEAGRQALQEAMQRRGVSATVTVDGGVAYRVHYHPADPLPHVTLVVPTRNGGRLLQTCIDSVLALTDYPSYDIVIVDNGSDQTATLELLARYARHPLCSVVRDPRPFNYAALHNAVVPGVRGEFVLLLNDDVEAIDAGWLREMVAVGLQPGVGVVGARLLYPNDTLQHGGVILVGGVAGHAHKHLPADDGGYMMRARVRQTLSAVTAACMLVSKSVYQQVGGMDEQLAVAFNDVAFCLAVGAAGYRIVWTPYAELYHHESATRGYEDNPQKRERFGREIQYMQQRWGARLASDPHLNPNLDNMREDFALARPPRLSPLFGDGVFGTPC